MGHTAFDPNDLSPSERHKLTIGTIVPRPIAWTTSISPTGVVNLAPFSYFMGCHSYVPALAVSMGSRAGAPKDSRRNILANGEFVVNIVSSDVVDRMVLTAADFPPEISELEVAGLTAAPSSKVAPPRIVESPIQMECRVIHSIDLGEGDRVSTLFVGQILMWHVRSDLVDSSLRVDQAGIDAVARMGGPLYTHAREIFRRLIPDWREVIGPDDETRPPD